MYHIFYPSCSVRIPHWLAIFLLTCGFTLRVYCYIYPALPPLKNFQIFFPPPPWNCLNVLIKVEIGVSQIAVLPSSAPTRASKCLRVIYGTQLLPVRVPPGGE